MRPWIEICECRCWVDYIEPPVAVGRLLWLAEPSAKLTAARPFVGQDQPFMADSSLASRPDAEAQARRVVRSNAVV
jgi:hypothetical protein